MVCDGSSAVLFPLFSLDHNKNNPMKKTSQYNTTNSEPKSTSKKYIKRVYETKEAEEAIKQYTVEENLSPHELEERFKDTHD